MKMACWPLASFLICVVWLFLLPIERPFLCLKPGSTVVLNRKDCSELTESGWEMSWICSRVGLRFAQEAAYLCRSSVQASFGHQLERVSELRCPHFRFDLTETVVALSLHGPPGNLRADWTSSGKSHWASLRAGGSLQESYTGARHLLYLVLLHRTFSWPRHQSRLKPLWD